MLGSTALLVSITIGSKFIGFAREVILLETVGVGVELDIFVVLYGIATLLIGALGICIVTSVTPLARGYTDRAGALTLMRGGLVAAAVTWLAATLAALVYTLIGTEGGGNGRLLALIVPGIVPFAILAEYQVGLFLARGQRTPVICGNIILSLPLALALLVFDMSIVEYACGLVVSFALRVAIFAWLLTRGSEVASGPRRDAPPLFGKRLPSTLAGGSAMLAMTTIYVTVTMAARYFGEGQATVVGYGLKLPLLVLTSVWFVLGTGFFADILDENHGTAVRRVRRLTILNLVLLLFAALFVFGLRTPVPLLLGWPQNSQMLTIMRQSLAYMPLILFVPTIEMVQRLYVTSDRHMHVGMIAVPTLVVGLALQALGISLGNIDMIVASPSCAALAGFLVAIFLIRDQAASTDSAVG